MVSVPCSAAARASSRLSPMVSGPSSTAGSRWKWRSAAPGMPPASAARGRIRSRCCESRESTLVILGRAMPRPPLALRFAALLSVAALLLHEIRYLVGFGDRAGQTLADRGHGYLSIAGVLAIVMLALA